MRLYKGYYIPSIQEIKNAQEKTEESNKNGKHIYTYYEPKTGLFQTEIENNKTHHYKHFITYIPPWRDAYEIRDEIIQYIKKRPAL